MSIWVEIKCDKCNKIFDQAYYSRDNVQKLKENAKSKGWIITYKTGICICPECQDKESCPKK